MISDLRERVQAAVGGTYRIEQELGGGGMSRVFLADEVRLGRHVVIKVLPPELALGVNADRFEREIVLAARLQHPHVVPLLTAGARDDLLYYVMPYIEGESLRARLAREGELPVGEAVHILRDVLDALSYAHEQGIVHRDIKPDNVLLSRGHALVTDFGVAKAVASSTGEASLTSLGMALGTPAYMSPEQAAGDAHVDHRADLYALGAMAYEMLTGRPPFTGGTPQAVLSAHISQPPEQVTAYRELVPAPLAGLVMQCLAKKPADRPQRAAALIEQLETLMTPTGGITPVGTQPVPPSSALPARFDLLRVGVFFALGAAVVLGVVYGLMLGLGLPSWVFFAAIALLTAGLPAILLTGWHEHRRALARATGADTMTPTGVRRLFTWRRVLAAGGVAFGALGVVAGGFMALRSLGIGPFATLVSSGKLANRARILVAEFDDQTTDSTLGRSLTEAFRIDLSQSPVVREVNADVIGAALKRMERPDSTRLTLAVAREIAQRQGVPAIIAGTIAPVGQGYVLSARVLASGDGTELAADRETAPGEADILAALSRLSRAIRKGIGESYRSLRETKPLEDVTTNSLEALRLYSRAAEAERVGNYPQALDLYRQATVADTQFAMAYRKMAVALAHLFSPGRRLQSAAARAFRLRDRLPPVERYVAEGYYDNAVLFQPQRAIAAYRAALAIDPDNEVALSDLAGDLAFSRQWTSAESLYVRALAMTDSNDVYEFTQLAGVRVQAGDVAGARRVLEAGRRKLPQALGALALVASRIAYAEGAWDSALAYARLAGSHEPQGSGGFPAALAAAASLTVQGKLAAAREVWAQHEAQAAAGGDRAVALRDALIAATDEGLVRGNPDSAGMIVDAALHRYPLEHLRGRRPWGFLIFSDVAAGRAAQARTMLEGWKRAGPTVNGPAPSMLSGTVLLAEHRLDSARAEFARVADEIGCNACIEPLIAQAWDEAGDADSALAHYERYLTTQDLYKAPLDADLRPIALRRAGELAQQLGRRAEAMRDYADFVTLWQHADPDLQPIVRDVKARLGRLGNEGG